MARKTKFIRRHNVTLTNEELFLVKTALDHMRVKARWVDEEIFQPMYSEFTKMYEDVKGEKPNYAFFLGLVCYIIYI